MSNTPSKAEIEALVKRHGATSYRNRADTQHPAYGFTEDGLNGLIDEVLAKWGTPQPVVREPLTDAQIAEMMRDAWGCASIAPRHALEFARAVEAEVRKQDDALIQQMLEALERAKKHHFTTSLPLVIENYGSKIKCANEGSIVWRDLIPSAITAARTRLVPSTEPASA